MYYVAQVRAVYAVNRVQYCFLYIVNYKNYRISRKERFYDKYIIYVYDFLI